MIIRYKKNAQSEREAENTFEAYDDLESYMGEAGVESTRWPLASQTRPTVFTIRLKGESEAADALLGAATAHALHMAKDETGNVCIRVETDPADLERLSPTLAALGYMGKSALLRMSAPVHEGPVTVPIPEGLTVVRDYLNDEKERAFYLERINLLFDGHRDAQWLEQVREKDCFTRMLLIDRDGAVGEMITWAQGDTAIAENIWVHPDWRNCGAGKFLMEFARIYWLECGLKEARMDIWSLLTPAIRLAFAAGFQPTQAMAEYPYMDVRGQAQPEDEE